MSTATREINFVKIQTDQGNTSSCRGASWYTQAFFDLFKAVGHGNQTLFIEGLYKGLAVGGCVFEQLKQSTLRHEVQLLVGL